MTKLFVSLPALALVVALSGSATAENGVISSATLNDMGLTGIELMSDLDAMEIRGQGFESMLMQKKPWALAFGVSYAFLETDQGQVYTLNGTGGGGLGGGGLGGGSAGTLDGFLALGRYSASGSHMSEAIISRTTTYTETVPGVGSVIMTQTMSLGIGAGGSASSMAF